MFIQLKAKFFIRELEQSEISTCVSSLNLTASGTGRFKTGGTPASGYIRHAGGCLSGRGRDVSTWLEWLLCRKFSNVSLLDNDFLQSSTSMFIFLLILGVHVR